MIFSTRRSRVTDPDQQYVNQGVYNDLNELARFFSWGDGAPTHTPDGPQVYFEQDGPGVHYFNGVWNVLP